MYTQEEMIKICDDALERIHYELKTVKHPTKKREKQSALKFYSTIKNFTLQLQELERLTLDKS